MNNELREAAERLLKVRRKPVEAIYGRDYVGKLDADVEACAKGILATYRPDADADAVLGRALRESIEALHASGVGAIGTETTHDEAVNAFVVSYQRQKAEIEALQKFKDYVHQRLDTFGVPVDPDSPHKAAGCRIGGRLDWLFAECNRLTEAVNKHHRPDDDEPATAEWVEAAMSKPALDTILIRIDRDGCLWIGRCFFGLSRTRRDVRDLCRILKIPMKDGA